MNDQLSLQDRLRLYASVNPDGKFNIVMTSEEAKAIASLLDVYDEMVAIVDGRKEAIDAYAANMNGYVSKIEAINTIILWQITAVAAVGIGFAIGVAGL
jgi:hypothetical protein